MQLHLCVVVGRFDLMNFDHDSLKMNNHKVDSTTKSVELERYR